MHAYLAMSAALLILFHCFLKARCSADSLASCAEVGGGERRRRGSMMGTRLGRARRRKRREVEWNEES